MSDVTNPYASRIKKLDDVKNMVFLATDAIDILRKHMVTDPSHDEGHIVRVVRNALWFGQGGDSNVIIPAAILHDLVNVPKDHPDRHLASSFSAEKAIHELKLSSGGPALTRELSDDISHAIEAHSWSARVPAETLEAEAVQDADRIEALGCIGIARLFSVGGAMGRALFHPSDPLAKNRDLDELTYTLDHHFVKLRKLPDTMKTERGIEEARVRLVKMESFIEDLVYEIGA
jgi:uncharacterized protein